jgi:hypothetical protein
LSKAAIDIYKVDDGRVEIQSGYVGDVDEAQARNDRNRRSGSSFGSSGPISGFMLTFYHFCMQRSDRRLI